MEVLLGDRQAIGHLRAHAVVIGIYGVPVIARPFEISDVLALAVFKICEPECGLIVKRLDTSNELDFAMVVGM